MATLRELYDIEVDSRNAVNSDPEVMNAANLRARMKVAVRVHARTFLNGDTIEFGNPSRTYPAGPQEANEAIAWAQKVIASPDRAVEDLLGLALAGAEQLNVTQILERDDTQLKAGIEPLIPMLAKGMHPGQ